MAGEHERLLNLLIDECNLQDLTDTCADLLGFPIRFVFMKGRDGFIASGNYDGTEAVREQQRLEQDLAQLDQTLPYVMQEMMEQHLLRPFIVEGGAGERRFQQLLCVASTGKSADGIVTVQLKDAPPERVDQELMALCARCLALCLHQRRWNHRVTHFRRAMQQLLQSHGISYQEIVHEAGSQALPASGRYRLLDVLCLTPQENNSMAVLAGQLSRWLKTEWLYEEQHAAILLFDASQLSDALPEQLEPLLLSAGCAACLSPEYTSLMDTGLWRSRISRLPAFRSAQPGTLVYYEKWLDWGLLTETKLEPDALESFIPAGIRRLRQADRTHGTDYLPTLTAYFENQCNKKRTAVALGTHVNTIAYRMQKIEEIGGLSLEAPETLFTLPAVLRLMRYQQAQTAGRPPED